ncbi:unnamed protein product [Cuscuta europaea]|uniref:Uncharacterized protein n=1 Tax=Cuscuta europaea TaxID=41803 RepID=A0A9P1E4P4_CUSEU|nr:unnamed protein product [Cuscuta europaea]
MEDSVGDQKRRRVWEEDKDADIGGDNMALDDPKNGGAGLGTSTPRGLKTLLLNEVRGKPLGLLIRVQLNFHSYVFMFVFYFDQTVFIFVVYVYFRQTLALGLGDEGSLLTALGSFRPITGSANHIAFHMVIGSKSGSRVGGWKWTFYLFVPFLNAVISIYAAFSQKKKS